MSDNYETTRSNSSGVQSSGTSDKVAAAKQEAADLTGTVGTEAKTVVASAKDEAASVVGEAKTQAKDLYAQTQRELKEQAGTQQKRVAEGLRAVGDDLGSMAANANSAGVASDLVQQVSARLSAAATWLGDRDPSAVLAEVKQFARRKPGTFILGAAVAGIAVGRLTRALAANASDNKAADGDTLTKAQLTTTPVTTSPATQAWSSSNGDATTVPLGDTPVYAQNFPTPPATVREGSDERSDTI